MVLWRVRSFGREQSRREREKGFFNINLLTAHSVSSGSSSTRTGLEASASVVNQGPLRTDLRMAGA